MPVVKLHVTGDLSPQGLRHLADAARQVLVEALELPVQFGKVLVYTTPLEQRSVHPQRDPRFVLAEVHLFRGRTDDVKARLIAALDQAIRQATGLTPENVFIHLIESPRSNWGIRGGRPAGDVDLGY